jgi:hypothetical protein
MSKDKWIWMPHAGHFIGGHQCRFKLNTYVNGYIISTVGELVWDSQVREIMADNRKVKLEGRGDAREYDYLKKLGYEDIGLNRKYETMVFKARKSTHKCCPYEMAKSRELECDGYNNPEEAYLGHLKLCEKYDKVRK